MNEHEVYMSRCIELAKPFVGKVFTNPVVGAVLVYQGRVIGEGSHQYFGGPHAEVNCIRSVKTEDQELIPDATLYVSLEPCAHFGKTPPCADLIVSSKIKKVVVGSRDPFVEVNGKGIEKLQHSSIEVVSGVLEDECRQLNKRFFTFHMLHRPFIVLKWAQSQNGKIATSSPSFLTGNGSTQRLHISNEFSNRLVHRWRMEESSILVGTNTAAMDDPELTNRLWPGPSPTRLVIDLDLKLPSSLKLFSDRKANTIVFNTRQHELDEPSFFQASDKVGFYQVTGDVSLVQQVVHALHQLKIQSVLVEGGAALLQSFIDEELWDEARIITNPGLQVSGGLQAPSLSNYRLVKGETIVSDQIHYFAQLKTNTTKLETFLPV